jgi:acyl carrier protein
MSDIKTRVIAIISEITSGPREVTTDSELRADLCWDDIDFMQLELECDDQIDARIDIERIEESRSVTVGDIINAVEAALLEGSIQ